MNNMQKIIKEICDEKKISLNLVSKDWIIILQKEDKIRYIVGYKFPLNNQSVSKICDDKYALYEIMNHFNIPVAQHYLVFKNYDKNSVFEYCEKYGFNMVVKNNLGTCGNDMYHVATLEELFIKLDELLSKGCYVSLSPYYDIKTEYRTITLNGNIELIYGKKRPIVIGDGKSTIYELLCNFNKNYFYNISEKESLLRVLDLGKEYEYNWQFNLSKGAMPFLLDDFDMENKIREMVGRITSILSVGFVSIDIIELVDGSLLLLEVNSGVMMENISKNLVNGTKLAKNIYTKVLDEMFK